MSSKLHHTESLLGLIFVSDILRSKGWHEIRGHYLPCAETLVHPAPAGPVSHAPTHTLTCQSMVLHVQDRELLLRSHGLGNSHIPLAASCCVSSVSHRSWALAKGHGGLTAVVLPDAQSFLMGSGKQGEVF